MRLAIFLTLLLAVTKAHECTDAEIEQLFFYLTPVLQSGGVTTLDFSDTNSAVCSEAKTLIKEQGDSYSETFLDKFCECSVHVGYDILSMHNVDCDLNGQNVNDLKDACGDRYCATADTDLTVRGNCFCQASWLVSTVPPNVGSDAQNTGISTYCTDIFKGFLQEGLTENQECACFTGYYPLETVNEYIGCKFAKSLDPRSGWADSISFAEYAAGCQLDVLCRDCAVQNGHYYDLQTGACTQGSVPTDAVKGIDYVDTGDDCWDYVLPSALSRRVGFNVADNSLNPTKYAPDCKQCTGNLYVYWVPSDGSTPQCVKSCPAGASDADCILGGGECPDLCPSGTCGSGDCFSDGDCICGTNGFGKNCEVSRHEVVVEYSGSLSSTQLSMDASFTIDGVTQTATNKNGFPFRFNFPQQTVYSLDPYGSTTSVCYFLSGNRRVKILEGTVATDVEGVDVECVTGEMLILNIGGLTVSGDGLSALYQYVNTEFVTAMQQAVQVLDSNSNIPNYYINLETTGIVENSEGISFIYNVESGEVTDGMRVDSFASTVENCMKKQPYLAQFWATSTVYVTFEMTGVTIMCVDCLTSIVATATSFELGSISVITTPMTGVTGGYVINALFKGSDAQITTLNAQVLDGTFETNVEAGLAESSSFTVSDITVSDITVIPTVPLTPSPTPSPTLPHITPEPTSPPTPTPTNYPAIEAPTPEPTSTFIPTNVPTIYPTPKCPQVDCDSCDGELTFGVDEEGCEFCVCEPIDLTCKRGDVKVMNGVPYYHDGLEFRGICAHWFDGSNHGVNKVCQMLKYDTQTGETVSYSGGQFEKRIADVGDFYVGTCHYADDFPNCDGTNFDWGCSGNPGYEISCDEEVLLNAVSCEEQGEVDCGWCAEEFVNNGGCDTLYDEEARLKLIPDARCVTQACGAQLYEACIPSEAEGCDSCINAVVQRPDICDLYKSIFFRDVDGSIEDTISFCQGCDSELIDACDVVVDCEEGEPRNKFDSCDNSVCVHGEFVEDMVQCPADVGVECDGDWVQHDGACCEVCEEVYCKNTAIVETHNTWATCSDDHSDHFCATEWVQRGQTTCFMSDWNFLYCYTCDGGEADDLEHGFWYDHHKSREVHPEDDKEDVDDKTDDETEDYDYDYEDWLDTIFPFRNEEDAYTPAEGDQLYESDNIGTWGGLCRCPSGSIYQVGDLHNCETFACEGGEVVTYPDGSPICRWWDDDSWSGKGVVCEEQ